MARLYTLVAGREPAVADRPLVEITLGGQMFTGTTVPRLRDSYTARHSGLLVPAGSVPHPLAAVRVYLTAEELFGVTPPSPWILDQLARRSLDDLFQVVICGVARPVERKGCPRSALLNHTCGDGKEALAPDVAGEDGPSPSRPVSSAGDLSPRWAARRRWRRWPVRLRRGPGTRLDPPRSVGRGRGV
jgi:hypothetical protein